MKKTLSFLTVFAIVLLCLAGCNKKDEERIKQLEDENRKLQALDDNSRRSLEEVSLALSEIHDTVMNIKNSMFQKDKFFYLNDKSIELSKSITQTQKEEIENALSLFRNEIKANKAKLASLAKKLKESNVRIAGFQELIAKYEKMIDEKDQEITEYKDQIEKLTNLTIVLREENLKTQDTVKSVKKAFRKEIENKYTIYYASGAEDAFLEKGILKKQGTWPVRTLVLSGNYPENEFDKTIQLLEDREIVVAGVVAKILPEREKDTYEIRKISDTESKIIINNKDGFIKQGKYLLIILD